MENKRTANTESTRQKPGGKRLELFGEDRWRVRVRESRVAQRAGLWRMPLTRALAPVDVVHAVVKSRVVSAAAAVAAAAGSYHHPVPPAHVEKIQVCCCVGRWLLLNHALLGGPQCSTSSCFATSKFFSSIW